MSDNYDVYVNDDTEPNVSVSADSDVSALVDDDSNVVLDVEEDAGALLNADINDEELVDVPIEETIGELGADHRRLLHRDAADQHPMSAITGLTDSLTSLQNTIDSGLISVETSVSDVTLLANGKNTVYHSSSAPTGGEYKVGDTWFNSSESYCMYKWDGSNWVREQFGNGAFANASIWNATIQDGAITNAKIANATIENGKIKDATIEGAKIKDATITNAKISSLSGDKITANSLTIGKMASDVTSAISSAGATASNYLTYISGRDGICVHESGDTSNYVNLNSNGMGVFAGGALRTSVSSSGVNLYGGTNIGASITSSGIDLYGNGYLGASITSSGMTVYSGGTNIASFGSTTTIGKTSGYHVTIDNTLMSFHYTTLHDVGGIKADNTSLTISSNEVMDIKSSDDMSIDSDGELDIASSKAFTLETKKSSVSLGTTTDTFRPTSNGVSMLGSPNYHWTVVYADTGSINTSDRKKKDVLGDIDFAEDFIMSLEPIQYQWKASDHRRIHMGFIAQDVAKASRALGKDLSVYDARYKGDDEEGQKYFGEEVDDEKLNWGMSYAELIAPLVKVVQTQNKRIAELEKRVL